MEAEWGCAVAGYGGARSGWLLFRQGAERAELLNHRDCSRDWNRACGHRRGPTAAGRLCMYCSQSNSCARLWHLPAQMKLSTTRSVREPPVRRLRDRQPQGTRQNLSPEREARQGQESAERGSQIQEHPVLQYVESCSHRHLRYRVVPPTPRKIRTGIPGVPHSPETPERIACLWADAFTATRSCKWFDYSTHRLPDARHGATVGQVNGRVLGVRLRATPVLRNLAESAPRLLTDNHVELTVFGFLNILDSAFSEVARWTVQLIIAQRHSS